MRNLGRSSSTTNRWTRRFLASRKSFRSSICVEIRYLFYVLFDLTLIFIQTAFMHVNKIRNDVIKNLSLYYYTFADLLDLKDHILQLLTTMDVNQCQLDIVIHFCFRAINRARFQTLNYDLTAGYLNLVINYICIMILLSRIEDRKIVLGLFNVAYDFKNNGSEASFPRLGQMESF